MLVSAFGVWCICVVTAERLPSGASCLLFLQTTKHLGFLAKRNPHGDPSHIDFEARDIFWPELSALGCKFRLTQSSKNNLN